MRSSGTTKSAKAKPAASAGEVARDRALFIELIGQEISAIWGNVTRLGGQCVAALYLWNAPRSMDDLAEELGRSKSNVFANLRALESLGIVRRIRMPGSTRDHFELAAPYPDVIVVAFVRKLSAVLGAKSADLQQMTERLERIASTDGEAREIAPRVARLQKSYAAASELLDALLPPPGKSIDLVSLLDRIPTELVRSVARALRGERV